MPTPYRIALATPPFPKSLEHGLECVEKFTAEAARREAKIVCFPESYLPGYRLIDEPVEAHSPKALEAALERAREIARRHRIGIVLPMDWDHEGAIRNVAVVISSDGNVLGHQTKNQVDPTEDELYVPGSERDVFEIDGLVFGITICHEGFRYPELVRWAARRGAQLVFHPHLTGSNRKGTRLREWRHRDNPYYESAMMCRALENTIYFASVNYALEFQESASTVVSPSGELVGAQPYGEAGVLIADLDLTMATRRLALRYKEPN